MDSQLNYLSFIHFFPEKDEIWFLNENWTALFKMRRDIFEPRYVDFPRECFGQYKWIGKWGDRCVLVPTCSKAPLYIIDNEKNHYTIEMPISDHTSQYSIHKILQKDNKLYIITHSEYISIIEFDIEICAFVKQFEWAGNITKGSYYLGDADIYGNSIWSVIIDSFYLVEIKLDTFAIEIHRTNLNIQYSIKSAYCISDHYYYALGFGTGDRTYIVKTDLSNNNNECMIIDISEYSVGTKYNNIVSDTNTVWLFPGDDTNILKINLLTKKTIELKYPKEFFWIKDQRYASGLRFTCIEDVGSTLILYPRTGSGILKIDKISDAIQYYPLNIDMEKISQVQAKAVNIGRIAELQDNVVFLLGLINKNDNSIRDV